MRWKTTVVKKASKVSFEKSFDSGSRSDHDDKPVVGVIAAYTRLVHGLKLAASASRDSVDIVIRRTPLSEMSCTSISNLHITICIDIIGSRPYLDLIYVNVNVRPAHHVSTSAVILSICHLSSVTPSKYTTILMAPQDRR